MFVDLADICAVDRRGDLINKEIVINIPQYAYAAQIKFKLLPYNLHDVFTVVSEIDFEGELHLGIMNDTGLPACAPAKWFNVLEV